MFTNTLEINKAISFRAAYITNWYLKLYCVVQVCTAEDSKEVCEIAILCAFNVLILFAVYLDNMRGRVPRS